MAYEITGKVKEIMAAQTFGGGFTKREIVVTVEDGKYPQDIILEFVQEKIGLLDGLSTGQTVNITFDIRGREYKGSYYNNLQGWKLSAGEVAPSEGKPSVSDKGVPADFDEYEDDIPF